MPNANIVVTEESLNCNVPVTQGGVIGCPASHFMTATEENSFINAQIALAFQPQEELWVLGSHPPTTQPVVQLVPVRSPVNSAPPPKGAVGDSGPANVQNSFPENCLSKQDSVYGNIQRWQHIKTLVQRHLSQTPDVSAFSCFLMFTEFENAEEKENSRLEIENSRLEMMRSIKSQVVTSTRQDPHRPPAPEVFEEPACNSMKTCSKTDPACLQVLRHRQLQKTESPMEIPPEAVQEYMDIMDWLERLPQVHTGESTEKVKEENSEPEQKEDDFYSAFGVLSYIDELCSQKHLSCSCGHGLSDSASIPNPLSPKKRDLSPDPPSNDKSKKPALIGGLKPMATRSNSGLGHGIFEGPLSALGLTHSLQAQKKFESLSTRKRKRKK
ncbi:Protein FAM22 [Cricetulus griseus]|uniref:Protein FAM22 n=1 Tax=Cricetulus griseus TaxID=10029 RepID=G3IL52_CRIGR|nr:Protein FAM22 [Cricetulus griseus]